MTGALCCLFILIYIVGASLCSAEGEARNSERVRELIDGIVDFKTTEAGAGSVQDWIDGALAENAGTTSEWYIIALGETGEAYDFSSYSEELSKYLEGGRVSGASSRQKYALAFSVSGGGEGYIASVLEDSIGEQGIMSLIFGLKLLNRGYESPKYSADEVKDELLALRLEDGGWALSGARSDIDVTSMTVQALAPYYFSDERVKAAADEAVIMLSERQNADGDYSSFGADNPESAAQVILALTALKIDCLSDSRFIKGENTLLDGILKYALEDGSFRHTEGGDYSHNATVQVFYSLIALRNQMRERQPSDISGESGKDEASEIAAASGELSGEGQSEITTESEKADGSEGKPGYKFWVYLMIAAIASAVSVILAVRKKLNIKNFIAVLLIAAAAVSAVALTDVKSVGEYYGEGTASKKDAFGSVTLSIRCDAIAGREEYIPEDGIILETARFDIAEGDSVFDVLTDAARRYGLRVENDGGVTGAYISGINYIYEFDFGELSGWTYLVNGKQGAVGCESYALEDGDAIEWRYTCDLGKSLT